MLQEPWSTIRSARGNVAFLRDFTADGWVTAGFCRTLPYVGTPIERRLREEGRLVGPALDAEYRFLDPKVDLLWDFCLIAFEGRNYGPHSTWSLLRGLQFDTHIDQPDRPRDPMRDEAVRALVRASNGVMLDVLEQAIDLIDDGSATTREDPDLLELARLARQEDRLVRCQITEMVLSARQESSFEALFR